MCWIEANGRGALPTCYFYYGTDDRFWQVIKIKSVSGYGKDSLHLYIFVLITNFYGDIWNKTTTSTTKNPNKQTNRNPKPSQIFFPKCLKRNTKDSVQVVTISPLSSETPTEKSKQTTQGTESSWRTIFAKYTSFNTSCNLFFDIH